MAEIIRYVNFASAAGGDGTTNATTGTTRAYHSLSDALVAQATNLVVAGDNLVIRCGGSTADTDQIVVGDWSGFTTGASNDIRIEAETGNEAGTTWDVSKYRLFTSSGAIRCNTNQFVTFSRMQMGVSGSSGYQEFLNWNSSTDGTTATRIHILNCFVNYRSASSTSGFLVFPWGMRNGDVAVVNTIFDGTGATALDGGAAITCPGVFYNNLLIRSIAAGSHGFRNEATDATIPSYVKNNIFIDPGAAGACIRTSNTFTATAGNITSDATSPQVSLRSLTPTFVSATDLALSAADTAAKDAGSDLSADAQYAFSTDILGTTRGASWDIGPFELAGGGGGLSIPIAMHHLNSMRHRGDMRSVPRGKYRRSPSGLLIPAWAREAA